MEIMPSWNVLCYSKVDLNCLCKKYILSKNGVIGKVEEYVIWYELQHHGSVSVHVILWAKKENVESIGKEIIAFVPTILNATTNKFIESIDSMQNLLYRLAVRKHSHNCHNRCVCKKEIIIDANSNFLIHNKFQKIQY
jgi:hypothetical protein